MTIEQLEKERASRLDPLDFPGTWSDRERMAYVQETMNLDNRLRAARAALKTGSEVDPIIARLTKEKADVGDDGIRGELCEEVKTIPPRPRGVDAERLQNLTISIKAIDGRWDLENEFRPTPFALFEKLIARGYVAPPHAPWNPMAALYGNIETITWRLNELTKQRDEAQRRLELALRDSV